MTYVYCTYICIMLCVYNETVFHKCSHFQTQSLVPLLLNRCHTMALMPTGHLAQNVPFFLPLPYPTPTYTVILPAASAQSPT